MTIQEFYKLEEISRDTIDVKKIYIDMADDFVAGILLSQIVYWFLPSKTGVTKLRVKKKGVLWLAKSRTDWFDEVRLSPREIDRAINILKKQGLIITEIHRFNGSPMVHIRINNEKFLAKYERLVSPKNTPVLASLITNPLNGNNESVKSITEITTEINNNINNNGILFQEFASSENDLLNKNDLPRGVSPSGFPGKVECSDFPTPKLGTKTNNLFHVEDGSRGSFAFKYYMVCYKKKFNKDLYLKLDQLQKVLERLNDYSDEKDLDEYCWIRMIDRHFDTEYGLKEKYGYKQYDYNINAFDSEILENCWWETIYKEQYMPGDGDISTMGLF